jgi:hypothetical protein
MKRLTHPRPHKTEQLEKNIEKEDLSILQVEFSMHERMPLLWRCQKCMQNNGDISSIYCDQGKFNL